MSASATVPEGYKQTEIESFLRIGKSRSLVISLISNLLPQIQEAT